MNHAEMVGEETYRMSTRLQGKGDDGIEAVVDYSPDGFGGEDYQDPSVNFFLVGPATECDYDIAKHCVAMELTLTKENIRTLHAAFGKALSDD